MVHLVKQKLFRKWRTKEWLPPGGLVKNDEAAPTRIHVIRYDPESFEEHQPEPGEDLRSLVDNNRTLWIDVRGLADHDTIRSIGESFGLSDLTLADLANVGQRPKCEELDNALLTISRMVTVGEDHALVWEQVSLIVGDGYLLTFQETHDDCFEPIRRRIRKGGKLVRNAEADLLCVLLLDAIVDGYFPVIEDFGEQLERIETVVLEQPRKSVMADIYKVKRELTIFRRAAWPLRDALSLSSSDRYEIITDKAKPFLNDVRDHIVQVVDVLESYRELASSLIDVYLSNVSNRTNEVMRVLTIFATIFIPLGFLAGVYGMNFNPDKPGNLPELDWKYGYVYFWALVVLIVTGLLVMFWRLGWLGNADDDR